MPTTVAAVIATLVLGLTPGAGARETVRRATLMLTSTAPLVVAGSGFASGEVVRLVAVTGMTQHRRTTIASAKGRLILRFGFDVQRCADLTVRAAGSRGNRAVLRRIDSCGPNGPPTKPRGSKP